MPVVDETFHVAPTTSNGFNVLQQPLRATACWRLEDHRFAFGSSFPSPGGQSEFPLLASLRPPKKPETDEGATGAPGDLLSVFGHADCVGSDDDNKTLSGRRATAVYGILVRDTSLWEKLYSSPHGSDAWGIRHVQLMLQFLGKAITEVDGVAGDETQGAIRSFQGDEGLPATGDADEPTRAKLFKAYMDALCVDASGTPFGYAPEDFLGGGADADGKVAYQGCGEFNPVLVPSKKQADRLDQDHQARTAAYRVNRRVVVYLFPAGTSFDISDWPCPRASEGTHGCKAAFWKTGGDERRQPTAREREHLRGENTFSCRFYDRIARFSPCEAARKSMQVWLLDANKKRMPGAPFRATVGSQSVEGSADDAGRALVNDVFVGDQCLLEWGGATSPLPNTKIYRYRAQVTLRFDDDAPESMDSTEAATRLTNLGYASSPTFEEAISRFQTDYGLQAAPWPDADTRTALWQAHASGGEGSVVDPPPEGGVGPMIEPLAVSDERVHIVDWAARRREVLEEGGS
jgi:hypothetical protein